MSEPLAANSYVLKIRNEEKMAVIRAENIRKKYLEIRDRKVAEKLSNIYNMNLNDEDLARQLQFYMYR